MWSSQKLARDRDLLIGHDCTTAGLDPSAPNNSLVREPIIPQLDAETYSLWESRQESRFELHHGFVVAFAGGTVDHAVIAANLIGGLRRLYPSPCRTFGSDVKVRASADTFYYPDVVVACSALTGNESSIHAPTLVAEVLSVGTRSYDLIDKRAAYRSIPSLAVYLIVHTDHRRIECDCRQPGGGWRTETVDIGEVHIGGGALSLDEIYGDTRVGAPSSSGGDSDPRETL